MQELLILEWMCCYLSQSLSEVCQSHILERIWGEKKKTQTPKFKTHQNLPCHLHPLFAPASVIIYSKRISVKQMPVYWWLCNGYYQIETQRCAWFRTLISNIHHVENYLLWKWIWFLIWTVLEKTLFICLCLGILLINYIL